jgi:hypothetical protein
MMQRYEPAVCQPSNFEIHASLVKEGEFPRTHLPAAPVYLCSEADARIEQLEKALKSCVLVLVRQRAAFNDWNEAVHDACSEADKALALMDGSSHG